MRMAEPERRPGKTPLLKQPEIEEAEEEEGSKTSEESPVNGSRSCSDSETTIPVLRQESLVLQPSNGSGDLSPEDENSSSPPVILHQGLQSLMSQDSTAGDGIKNNHISVPSKTKQLMRGTAICDGASPPPLLFPEVKVITTPAPESDEVPCDCGSQAPVLGQPYGDTVSTRSHLQKDNSQSSDAGTCSSLSRESSVEKYAYKDNTGVDLLDFIKKTLFKSAKDKKMLLQLEKDFKRFVADPKDQFLQLSEMCSYDRMLVHRLAAFYGMDHNINQTGKCVIVSKTKYTRVPDFSCEEYLKKNPDSVEQKKKILLKKPHSMEERGSRTGDKSQYTGNRAKSLSLEERQRSYDEKRRQIFGSASQDETTSYSLIEDDASCNANKSGLMNRDWSSTESSGYGTEDGQRRGPRGFITKSNSYGGNPAIHLDPLNLRTRSLSKADSIQSGHYEGLPVRSGKLTATSPEHSDQSPLSRCSSTDVSHSPSHGFVSGTGPSYPVLVATDPATIPPGSMVVNPQTLQPHVNADGSIYRYNPNEPPPWLVSSNTPQQPPNCSLIYSANVQYQDTADLCNRFAGITVGMPVEGTVESQHMVPLHHQQPQQQPQSLQHQHQHHPLLVSPSLTQPLPSNQQFPVSHTQFSAMQAPYYSNPQILTGQPVRYISYIPGHNTAVDAQGQSFSLSNPGTSSIPSGIVSYSVHPQPQNYSGVFMSANSPMQTSIPDQTSIGPNTAYAQTIFTGPLGESNGSGSPYSIPYVPANGVYSYTTYNPAGNSVGPGQVGPAGAFYGAPPQSSSPQLSFAGFAPGPGSQSTLRPATPPSQLHHAHGLTVSIAQPLNYHSQQGAGTGLGTGIGGISGHISHHTVSSPTQFHPGTIFSSSPQFPGQVRPVGQVVQMPVGANTNVATAGPASGHAVPHSHHPTHHSAPPLHHSQSFSVLRAGPANTNVTSNTTHLSMNPATNGTPTPPQQVGPSPHPVMPIKSMSMGCMRPHGGASTPDKDSLGVGMGIPGVTTFIPGINQTTAMQFPAQIVASGIRPAQQGEYRMVGAASIRPQIQPLHLALPQQPGQPVKHRQ
ncbi:cAMP-regulated phosphoprotein 21-like isoform X3 [Pomacea canaliculata]|uniref:cAMP-regulated phosphoprotein 21-like isoform X3 n=1 Tax=Pomacea canaliculata TaxID=400727 RepID=UPI000D735989|nr:cAMP-regulated phosphoprotein 21-like isoform X3 [Pomacea canaliculata]